MLVLHPVDVLWRGVRRNVLQCIDGGDGVLIFARGGPGGGLRRGNRGGVARQGGGVCVCGRRAGMWTAVLVVFVGAFGG